MAGEKINSMKEVTCPYASNTDAIELGAFLIVLKRKWKLCFASILIVTFAAGLGSFFLPKEYLAESILMPPDDSSINKLTIRGYRPQLRNPMLFSINKETLYFQFLDNLRSTDIRYKFFDENDFFKFFNNKYKQKEANATILKNEFSDKIKISFNDGEDSDTQFITVELLGDEPESVAKMLNDYIRFVDSNTVSFVGQSIKTKIDEEAETVTKKISSLRKVAEKRKLAIFDSLASDIEIAKQLGIVEYDNNLSFNYFNQYISTQTGVVEGGNDVPGYYKGVKVLQAELDAFKKMKNNDSLVPGLFNLLEEERFLEESLQLNLDNVHAVRVDINAMVSEKAEKPNKVLIVIVAFVFGVLLSAFFILFQVVFYENSMVEE